MPSKSKEQEAFMRLVYAYKKGNVKEKDVDEKVKSAADNMTYKQIKEFFEENVKLNKLITLLEKVSNKKVKLVIKESEIFKPLRIPERLRDLKEKFDKNCIFDHEEKILTYNGNIYIIEYNILLENYKDYLVNVDGNVNLHDKNLNSIGFKFGKVIENFYCSYNNLTSLKNCPEVVGENFYCYNNKLETLEYCPKIVKGSFDCEDNSKQFTEQEVNKNCKVGDYIHV